MTTTLSPSGLSALLGRPAPAGFAVWRLRAGRWQRIGVTSDRAAANRLADACATVVIVLPVGQKWMRDQ